MKRRKGSPISTRQGGTPCDRTAPDGATLVQAKELARHADVRMTRTPQYGLDDQAKALSGFRCPSGPLPKVVGNGSGIGRRFPVNPRQRRHPDNWTKDSISDATPRLRGLRHRMSACFSRGVN